VRPNCKFFLLATVAVLALIGAGCSGINAGHSVSPASFLLPGLLQNDSQPSQPDAIVPSEDSGKQSDQAV
jgi:hypothetical protein